MPMEWGYRSIDCSHQMRMRAFGIESAVGAPPAMRTAGIGLALPIDRRQPCGTRGIWSCSAIREWIGAATNGDWYPGPRWIREKCTY